MSYEKFEQETTERRLQRFMEAVGEVKRNPPGRRFAVEYAPGRTVFRARHGGWHTTDRGELTGFSVCNDECLGRGRWHAVDDTYIIHDDAINNITMSHFVPYY
jgi:hypothetical protein